MELQQYFQHVIYLVCCNCTKSWFWRNCVTIKRLRGSVRQCLLSFAMCTSQGLDKDLILSLWDRTNKFSILITRIWELTALSLGEDNLAYYQYHQLESYVINIMLVQMLRELLMRWGLSQWRQELPPVWSLSTQTNAICTILTLS